jgi:hypothetical protein
MLKELGDSYHCHHIFLIAASMVQAPLPCPLRSHLPLHLPCSSVGRFTHFLVSLLLMQLATNQSFCLSSYLSSSSTTCYQLELLCIFLLVLLLSDLLNLNVPTHLLVFPLVIFIFMILMFFML